MTSVAAVEHRVNELQQALLDLVRQNDRTARGLERLTEEMRGFKDETRQANADLRASLERQSAEQNASLDRQNAEFRASLDRQNAEFRASLDRQNADLRASLDRQNAEQNASLNRQNAELSRALGTLAEDILGPSIPTLFKRFFGGAEPEFAMRARKRHKLTDERREFDTPAWNDKVFLISETKARLRPGDLDSLTDTIAQVRNFFPEAEGKAVCAALASLYIDPSLVAAGERCGFLMIALGDNLAEVMNSEGFRPAEF